MTCIVNRLMVTAVAAYFVATFAHDEAVTWVVVAASMAAVLVWSRRGGLGVRLRDRRGARSAMQTELSALQGEPHVPDTAAGGPEANLGPTMEEVH